MSARLTLAPLPRSFFARDAETVARELVGTRLVHRLGDEVRVARVVETEAYVGPHDLACHAAKGRTKRTEVMFGEAGHAYVFLCYGVHELFNVTTGPVGHGEAVLLRAAEPVSGIATSMRGPGLMSRGLGITRADYGRDLTVPPLFFAAGEKPTRVSVSARIGVDYAGDWKDAPLRFFDAESRHVSRR